VILASGLASIHLVKYSMATTANLFPLVMVAVVQLGPCPISTEARCVGLSVLVPKALIDGVMYFGMLGMS